MKNYITLVAAFHIVSAGTVFAGTGLGGGGAGRQQLQEMALSETMLSAIAMQEVAGRFAVGGQLESLRMSRPAARMMESSVDQPAGVLIEVESSDFALIAADAANGKDFLYRDVPVRVTESDTENEIVTMSPIEDSSVTIVVKAAEGSSL